MARYLVTSTVNATDTDGRTPVQYRKGQTVDLTPAQVTALGASNFRAANNPGGTQTTTYLGGATSSLGIQVASPTHDLAGRAAGASN